MKQLREKLRSMTIKPLGEDDADTVIPSEYANVFMNYVEEGAAWRNSMNERFLKLAEKRIQDEKIEDEAIIGIKDARYNAAMKKYGFLKKIDPYNPVNPLQDDMLVGT